jgi:hypothetical protein
VSGTPTTSQHWLEGTKTVTVNDGKLTISNAAGSSNNRICYLDITAYDEPAIVGIDASASSVFEDGLVTGKLIAKQVDAPYVPGKRTGMLKVRRRRTLDCVVCGYRPGTERRRGRGRAAPGAGAARPQ